jgi:hypothetical protein
MHPMKPDWRALTLLASLCPAWLLFTLAPGCGASRPTDLEALQARLAERRGLIDRRTQEPAAAVDAHSPADVTRLDDLSRPAAETLRGLPGVARVDVRLSPAHPIREGPTFQP